ncbi:MAG: hypothetical protein CL916_08880 [Deltaproteobacteria bacterium]|nr:hypothetical protein [Deltaproteobacteria bacterium]
MRKLFSILQLAGFYSLFLFFGPIDLRLMPHFYLLFVIGSLGIVLQPGFSSFDLGTSKDRGTAAQIVWSIQFSQIAAVLESVTIRYPEAFDWNLINSVALICMIIGLLIRTAAVIHLGKAFTWHIAPEEANTLITNGIYRFCRHPSYLGAFFLYMGAILFLHAYYAAICALVLFMIAFSRRIKWEEIALKEYFGTEYDEYASRVGRFSPFRWL